jgi:hypothetical protein
MYENPSTVGMERSENTLDRMNAAFLPYDVKAPTFLQLLVAGLPGGGYLFCGVELARCNSVYREYHLELWRVANVTIAA